MTKTRTQPESAVSICTFGICHVYYFFIYGGTILCIMYYFFKKNVSRTLPKVCIFLRQNRLQLLNLIFSQLPWKINNKFNEKISEL